jgi:uncharacterized phage-associated protein
MNNKTQQLLAYIAEKHEKATVTVLMKTCYLIDLVSVNKNREQVSEYEYRRYSFGPFNERIYNDLSYLQSQSVLIAESDYTAGGDEYIWYRFNNEVEDLSFDLLGEKEKQVIDEVLESVKGFGARTLTEIAYKTNPMKALGATLGGDENINVKLDMTL